jgi:chemosensory pili system protein ChpA (sensor histidine kinase/response regulator)
VEEARAATEALTAGEAPLAGWAAAASATVLSRAEQAGVREEEAAAEAAAAEAAAAEAAAAEAEAAEAEVAEAEAAEAPLAMHMAAGSAEAVSYK